MQNSQMKCLLGMIIVLSLMCSNSLLAQTFDNPDSEIKGGVVAEAEESVSEVELDENPEAYEEEPVSENDEFDSFVPSEDISEDYSVPFPVDI